MKVKLLAPQAIVRTSELDFSHLDYKGIQGFFQRQRFALGKQMVEGRFFNRFLEVGFGSGIFMPELASHTQYLYGIDTHPYTEEVGQRLKRQYVSAGLAQGTVYRLPYPDEFFDGINVTHVLEYLDDPQQACEEIQRVLSPRGLLFITVQGFSPTWHKWLKHSTGFSDYRELEEKREILVQTLNKHFELRQHTCFPKPLIPRLDLHRGLVLQRKPFYYFSHARPFVEAGISALPYSDN